MESNNPEVQKLLDAIAQNKPDEHSFVGLAASVRGEVTEDGVGKATIELTGAPMLIKMAVQGVHVMLDLLGKIGGGKTSKFNHTDLDEATSAEAKRILMDEARAGVQVMNAMDAFQNIAANGKKPN